MASIEFYESCDIEFVAEDVVHKGQEVQGCNNLHSAVLLFHLKDLQMQQHVRKRISPTEGKVMCMNSQFSYRSQA